MLRIVEGSIAETNIELMHIASENIPSLLIDCTNAADPHLFFGEVDVDVLRNIYVVEVEMLYKYRDTIKNLDSLISQVNPKMILITDTSRLFNYDDRVENNQILIHAEKILKNLSRDIDIVLAKPLRH